MEELKDLLLEVEIYQENDTVDYSYYDKIQGSLKLASAVEIYWEDRTNPDLGYTYKLPNQYVDDETDLCIHVPQMDNEDGGDNGYGVHKHIYEIVSNDRVSKIVVV